MASDNPWSPDWRPDPSGRRLASIRSARRGAWLAGLVYLPVSASVLAVSTLPDRVALVALLVGLPAVVLLGAGLTSSALGGRTDAVVTGIAFAIGAPVAAVTSLVIGAFVIGAFVPGLDAAGPILRGGVLAAIAVAPVVALAAAVWVLLVRWFARPPAVTEVTSDAAAIPDWMVADATLDQEPRDAAGRERRDPR
jgi:hypothetical protein